MSETISAQEIFEKVWNHFVINEAPRSVMPISSGVDKCVYRGPNGTKCAVGILVTDEECAEWDSIGNVTSLFDRSLLPVRLVPHAQLLGALQDAHDDECKFDTLTRRVDTLKRIARDYGLTVPEAQS